MREECCILWGVKLLHLQRMLLSPLAWRDTGLATLLNEEAVCIWPLGYENPNFNLIPEHVEDCLGDIMLKTALFMLREEPASIFLVLRPAWRDRWLRGGDLRGAASEPAWRMSLKAAVIWCLCEVYAVSCELPGENCVEKTAWLMPSLHVACWVLVTACVEALLWCCVEVTDMKIYVKGCDIVRRRRGGRKP